MKKLFNITSIILEVFCEIVLIPFHIIKAMLNVAEELKK